MRKRDHLRRKTHPHISSHRHHEHRHGQHRADPEAARHIIQLRVLFLGSHSSGLQRHAADRTIAGFAAHNLRMHWANVFGDIGFVRQGVHRLQRHATFRTRTGCGLMYFRMHRTGITPSGGYCNCGSRRDRVKIFARICRKLFHAVL